MTVKIYPNIERRYRNYDSVDCEQSLIILCQVTACETQVRLKKLCPKISPNSDRHGWQKLKNIGMDYNNGF